MFATRSKTTACIATGLILALAFATDASSQPAPPQESEPLPSIAKSTTIFLQVEPELQRFVDKQERLPGQERRVLVRITPDPSTDIVWLDLDSGYLPKGKTEFGEDLGDKIREVSMELGDYLSGIVKYKFIRVRIGGKTLDEIFTPEYVKERKRQPSARAVATPVPGLVVLNPGHGKYFHHENNTWRYQRPDPYAGTTNVHEDFITPGYAASLGNLLGARSYQYATDIRYTRAINDVGIDTESNLSWSQLAARYYLKRILPDQGSKIWNLYPNGNPKDPSRRNLREYDEDLMARPKYANHINAETFISLHTNGAGPTARGALVMTKLSDPQSAQLASNIICYMKEMIHSSEKYSSYIVRSDAVEGNDKAEVREAEMPTSLIEFGFHTNTEDAVALQDSEFVAKATRGVEKGYRTFKKGETDCRPLTITNVPAVTGPPRRDIPYTVQFVGSPTYPLYLRSKVVTCPPNYLCSQNSTQYVSPGSAPGTLNAVARCTTAYPVSGSVIVLDRYLEDSDGVKSPMVRTSITCV